MRDYLEPMLGTTGATIAQFAITLVIVAIIILIVFWLIRTFTGNRIGTTAIRGRQPRLSVLDALPVDQKRRLVLVRRDNVEHLILIGGPTDLVVEAAIHRPSAAQRRAEAAARTAGQTQRYQSAPPIGEPMRGPAEEAIAEAPPPTPATWSEPPRAEPSRAEPARTGFVAPAAEPAAIDDEPERVDPVRAEAEEAAPVAETVAIAETVEVVEVAAEPAIPTVRAPKAPTGPTRAMASFLGAVGRGRTASEPAATEPQAEPRRPEPPMRPLGRATPLAPKSPEPPAEETIDVAPSVEPQRAEPPRVEPVRPQPRPAMPPAPPVAPPVMGDEPYGAPTADPDHSPRFEPIFDINPDDVRDPGRPMRPMREPATSAPFVEPPREPRLAEETLDEAPAIEPEDRSRPSSVGDLEKEMARLLGEISGSRRS
ncbi:flagellar biosynthetic protein FliO [Mesorhizobium sp. BR1-1-16]|uniref:flagellar biosynthetic protein FliO n=1 Tax=Mesorhizobium sp. BR1-1-16 TaxID=2876653 RepID=UPI001CCB82A9|nr:flagellar biosynthetic protein FliO [Mesorhizobium sp. BR1-1-16]MBZ9937607.1 flagellar biosynthetic protein FliO [Mesorhizobium sp. BR1-1-16]